MKKILFTGGGSAGHVLPNVALIEEIVLRGDAQACYIGSEGIEKSLITPLKIPYYSISCPKLIRGGGFAALKNNLKIPLTLRRAIQEAEKGLRLLKPDLVFSKGGYVALPVVLAAKRLKIPCVAHESDYSAGLANKLSAKNCRFVFTAFPETAKTLRGGKYGGAPIRRCVLLADRKEARRAWNIPERAKLLLAFGGGSGSKSLNDGVRNSLKRLTEKYFVLHICGKGNLVESTLKNYRQFEFVADMGRAYACADVVLSRAGAGTIFELLALQKPSVLVPLEGATRGDQWENAKYFHRRGLCRILPQGELSTLVETVDETFRDKELKTRLKESGFSAGNERILQELYALLYE